jgi:hypothetical protein
MTTYQAFAAPIIDTLAHFQALCQFFGAGFTTLGWVAQTGHGELAATGTGASYAFTNPVLPPTLAVAAMSLWTYRGAWVSGQTYPNGSNTASGTADLVTDNSSGGNGVTYMKITTNVATNLTVAPHSNATDWTPYQYEIWKSNGSNSSTLPIYFRIAYLNQGTASTARFHLSIGTGIDANGNVTNPVAIAGATTPVGTVLWDDGSANSATPGEMDMAGDADNVRFIYQRGQPTNGLTSAYVIDRFKNASGTDTNAGVYVGMLVTKASSFSYSSIILNPSIGTAPVMQSQSGWIGALTAYGLASTTAQLGGIPPYLIFPIIGYVANPLLGAVGFHADDVIDGTVVPVWNYGAPHYYLVNKPSATAGQMIDNIGSHGTALGIRWE